MTDPAQIARRHFVRQLVGCAGLALAPLGSVLAAAAPTRSLAFLHTHTGEALDLRYCSDGCYEPGAIARLRRFLRDFRTGEEHAVDAHLLDILYTLQVRADRDMTFEVISGYRSPTTNAALHRHSSGVAEHSLHMEGRAIDVRARGFATEKLRDHALSLAMGGVGYYAGSDFVHLDTGRFRTWTG